MIKVGDRISIKDGHSCTYCDREFVVGDDILGISNDDSFLVFCGVVCYGKWIFFNSKIEVYS